MTTLRRFLYWLLGITDESRMFRPDEGPNE